MPRASQSAATLPGLRMRQLMAATGLPKSTLLYYVDQGLLPPPVKSSANMAHYSPACVERAAFIKQMQAHHRLPLGQIRRLLELRDQGEEVTPLVDMLGIIFGQPPESLMDMGEFCRRSGLKLAQVKALRRAGLLLPLQKDGYDQQDLAIALRLAGALAQGLKPADLAYYHRLARQVVEHELALRRRLTKDLPIKANAQLTMRMVQGARALRSYVIDRVFQLQLASAGRPSDREE